MPSLPSCAFMSATKAFISSLVVRHMLIIRQSWAAMTGAVRPHAASWQSRNRSSARSAISMWGYSL